MKNAALRRLAVATALACSVGTLTACSPAADDRVSIAFIGDSASTDAIWAYVVDVLREESDRLDIDFVDRYAEGDYARQAELIQQEVARGVDGIIAPFYDPTAANAAIEDALAAGTEVYALLGVPALPADSLAKISSASTSWQSYGSALADIILPSLVDGDTVLWPAEVPSATYITGAVDGFERKVEDAGLDVTVSVLDASADSTTSASRQLAYLASHPDLGAIVTSGSIAIAAAVTALEQDQREPGNPPLAGFVTSPQASAGIRDGYLVSGVSTDFEALAKNGLAHLVAVIDGEEEPEHVEVPVLVITKDNLETTVPAALRGE